jgi:hypothetical protein
MDFVKNNNKIRSESSFSDKNLKKIKYIKSYGLSIFNKINDELCVLLVKRKYTYNFFNFVMNNYKFSKKGLVNIFNNISIEEKKKILLFDYDILWKILWWSETENNGISNIIYYKNKKIYNKNVIENILFVKECIYMSKNCPDENCILYSIPRGRKNYKNENSLLVACRETFEETGLEKTSYHLIYDFKKKYITDFYYKTIFFIGIYQKNISNIKFNFGNKEQLLEINGIKWMTINDLQLYCPYLKEMLVPAFNYVKKHKLIL